MCNALVTVPAGCDKLCEIVELPSLHTLQDTMIITHACKMAITNEGNLDVQVAVIICVIIIMIIC